MASSELARLAKRKENRKAIDKVFEDSNKTYLIHYSCESFYDNYAGNSRRVTSIAVRNLNSAQTRSWSIHKSAELCGCIDSINENLDKLEFHMLTNYFEFLSKNSDFTYVHWNMRDEAYGFQAIEHRFKVLGGTPHILQDDKKLDLARVLVALYGRSYCSHQSDSGKSGRLMVLTEINGIADLDALSGQGEADAFVNGEYLKLHRSTLRKVDMFANIIDRVHGNTLKTNAKFTDKYGFHPVAILEIIKTHPLFTMMTIASAVIIFYTRVFGLFN